MSILIHQERPLSVSTTSGSWIGNTVSLRGILKQVLIKSATESTMYDISLTNGQNDVVYRRTDVTGTLNEEIDLPITGVYTIGIVNATRDEVFTILLIIREA